ncbi:hypothetical protein [Motilimonas eburnea]|uniref:hypothetical protein n=1 Tax=Motilimonas eburnea TaxID=1737488 RepID=UPI001E421A3B|nr:hypothetical protein [Motilimonas eburnea]MCE2571903.1 hypothetical protein [Motilimonas eburnea]
MSGQSLVNDVVAKPLPRVVDKDSTIDLHKAQPSGKLSEEDKKHVKTQPKITKHPEPEEKTKAKDHDGEIDLYI